MGFEYTRNSINNIAEKCHEMMGLSAPITLDELKTAIQNMGIVLTAKTDMSYYEDNVIRHGAEDYEIYYNPKQSEQTQLWNLANAFGKIILFGLPQDVVFFLLYKNTLCRGVVNAAYLFIQCEIHG